jgi:hypothetical protein
MDYHMKYFDRVTETIQKKNEVLTNVTRFHVYFTILRIISCMSVGTNFADKRRSLSRSV